uniref:Uncharacterized protein n=1 Tax=Rhizophora mucronata TaxID=61149 RepID=A0A2P2Q2I9_RHIMU
MNLAFKTIVTRSRFSYPIIFLTGFCI